MTSTALSIVQIDDVWHLCVDGESMFDSPDLADLTDGRALKALQLAAFNARAMAREAKSDLHHEWEFTDFRLGNRRRYRVARALDRQEIADRLTAEFQTAKRDYRAATTEPEPTEYAAFLGLC